ncbi:MAG: hypothetical protein M3421_00140, partial [Bacteroidota bacterium]|nr:hypothetical protein [Bacteroidota bacterium]
MYGIAGLLLFPLRHVRPGGLVAGFVVCMLIYSFFSFGEGEEKVGIKEKGLAAIALQEEGKELTFNQREDLKNWNRYLEDNSLTYLKEKTNDITQTTQTGSFGAILGLIMPINIMIQSIYAYLFNIWDTLGF